MKRLIIGINTAAIIIIAATWPGFIAYGVVEYLAAVKMQPFQDFATEYVAMNFAKTAIGVWWLVALGAFVSFFAWELIFGEQHDHAG